MKVFRSILAIVVGFLAVAILSTLTDTILEKTGVFTPPGSGFFTPWMVITALLYRALYTILGGYLAAWIAPSKPVRHAIILGSIGTLFGILGAISSWGEAPAWFLIGIIVTALPAAWFGGSLRANQVPASKAKAKK